MQIHYMWINEFLPLKKTGINLSSRLIIEMEPLKGQPLKYVLTIRDNPDFIEYFFNEKGLQNNREEESDLGIITNVTTIIGKNGAGKTSILRYMKSCLPQGLEARVDRDLFIYSRFEEDKERFYIILPETIDVKLTNYTHIQFDTKEYGTDAGDTFKFTGHLSDPEYIYYSYLLDFNEDLTPWKGLTNLSTSFLMLEERRRIFEENKEEKTRETLLAACNDLDNLHLSEVARAIELITSDFDELPFAKPEYLTIEVDLRDILYFENQQEKYFELAGTIKSFRNEVSNDNVLINSLLRNF